MTGAPINNFRKDGIKVVEKIKENSLKYKEMLKKLNDMLENDDVSTTILTYTRGK